MHRDLLKIQLAMMSLVSCSSLLLGVSIGDRPLVVTSIAGAVTAFILVDRLRWIELSGWFANIVSIAVLVFTMREFVGAGSAGKLVAVANLLTYLLTVLMFQKKTPRLCWQLMILSVLQTSLAAIFNLNFENGPIFVLYLVIAIVAMILQSDFYQWNRIRANNEQNLKTAGRHLMNSPAVIQSKLPAGHNLGTRLNIVWPLLIGCLTFSFLLFHSLPNTRQQEESALNQDFSSTGASWRNDLNETGIVKLSNKLIFRARFFDYETNEKLLLNNQPYFRGMALSKLGLTTEGKTSWEAPYNHIFIDSYSKIDHLRDAELIALRGSRRVGIDVIAEPTSDPLLFTPMPVFVKMDQEFVPDFNRDLSALTRKRSKKTNQLTSFRYRLATLADAANRTLEAWPYRSFDNHNVDTPMESGSPEYKLLTELNPDMYPSLVQSAQRVAREVGVSKRIELCKALVAELSESNGFSYTLDYRNIDKDPEIDPVEDFYANYRSGHCAMFASALVLMLRSVDIPARYVVGYHGGNYNNLTDCYVIHGRNAHAWVEAYLPPEECTQEMFDEGMARSGGAWLTLDPTPSVSFENSSEALDLARSIWQDYVISPDHNKQSYNGPGPLQAGSLANSKFSAALEYIVQVIKADKLIQGSLIAVMFLFAVLIASRELLPSRRSEKQRATNPIRRLFGKAVSLVSSELGHRIQFGSEVQSSEIQFYRRLEKILSKHLGVQRRSNQTQQEFATETGKRLLPLATPDFGHEQMDRLVQRITTAFYQVRFGSMPLDNQAVANIENQLQKFEQILKQSSRSQ